jgi:alpha-L-fucosidase
MNDSSSANLRRRWYLPRQDGVIGGLVNTYECHVSRDGTSWGKPVAEGRFDNIENNPIRQVVTFAKPVSCRYVKLTSTSAVKGQPFASAAEIGILR